MAPIYSTVQKLTMGGMVIGGIMCVVGAIAPYWLVSDVQGPMKLLSIVNEFIKANMGIFLYCIEAVGQEECGLLPMATEFSDGWYFTARAAASACIIGSGLAGFIALCLACCRCCDRLIPLGILSFLSACAGAMSVIVFNKNMKMFTVSILDYQVASYGWSFYVFCVGVGLMGLLSFTACFSSPERNNNVGVVMTNPTPSIMVLGMGQTQTHPYVPLQDQTHAVGGQGHFPVANTSNTTEMQMPNVVHSEGYGY